jgi:hypothetical protein
MITYVYWTAIFVLAGVLFYLLAIKAKNWKAGSIALLLVLLVGWSAYYFSLQQKFVKQYGGVMTITIPSGQHHIATTWKGDNLWIENYDPKTNTCIFSEYSKGSILQGKVTFNKLKNRFNKLKGNKGYSGIMRLLLEL